jgi:hypothetical protein
LVSQDNNCVTKGDSHSGRSSWPKMLTSCSAKPALPVSNQTTNRALQYFCDQRLRKDLPLHGVCCSNISDVPNLFTNPALCTRTCHSYDSTLKSGAAHCNYCLLCAVTDYADTAVDANHGISCPVSRRLYGDAGEASEDRQCGPHLRGIDTFMPFCRFRGSFLMDIKALLALSAKLPLRLHFHHAPRSKHQSTTSTPVHNVRTPCLHHWCLWLHWDIPHWRCPQSRPPRTCRREKRRESPAHQRIIPFCLGQDRIGHCVRHITAVDVSRGLEGGRLRFSSSWTNG